MSVVGWSIKCGWSSTASLLQSSSPLTVDMLKCSPSEQVLLLPCGELNKKTVPFSTTTEIGIRFPIWPLNYLWSSKLSPAFKLYDRGTKMLSAGVFGRWTSDDLKSSDAKVIKLKGLAGLEWSWSPHISRKPPPVRSVSLLCGLPDKTSRSILKLPLPMLW